MSRLKGTAKKSSKPESETATLTMPQSGMIYAPSGVSSLEGWLRSLQQDSLASLTQLPVGEGVKMTSVTSGAIHSESFARWDAPSSCWRTFQASFLEMENGKPMGARLSGSFPRRAMTVSGTLYLPQMSEQATDGIDGGSWGTPRQ